MHRFDNRLLSRKATCQPFRTAFFWNAVKQLSLLFTQHTQKRFLFHSTFYSCDFHNITAYSKQHSPTSFPYYIRAESDIFPPVVRSSC